VPDVTVDLRVYALIDPDRAGTHSLPELAALLASGGATLFQLRDKHGSTRAMVEEARAIKQNLKGFGIPLLINDRVDLGPDAIIGLSIKTVAQAEAAPVDLLDYVGIGGVFATTSKDNPDPPIGVHGLALIAGVFRRRAPEMPLCAIAGIDAGNAASAVTAGVDGVAVISALSLAPSPTDATRELRETVDAALAGRRR
jgi:thiamine-phosphate pyrophosphorylase